MISGLINIPAVAFGMFSGGLIMKKFGIGVLGAAKLSLGSSFFGYLLLLSLFAMGCENSDVAGLTVSYHGYAGQAMQKELLPTKPLPQSIYWWKDRDWPEYGSQKFNSNQWKPLHSSGCCVMTLSWLRHKPVGFMSQVQIIFLITFNYYCHGTHSLSPVIPGTMSSSVGGKRFN